MKTSDNQMKSSYDVNSIPKVTANNGTKEISRCRRIFPQVLASTIKNLLLFDLGLSMAFSTIVIPVLTTIHDSPDDRNRNETIHLSASEASWFAGIPYICQPLGSLISAWLSEPLGRKKSMFLVNIPHLTGWLIMHNASEIWHVFTAVSLFGLGVGLMEAPILTYIGEICEPSVRGILTACSGLAGALGICTIFLLGSLTLWRDVALICCSIPILAMISICFIPETPIWLLSRNRPNDALKSLQWLRGWVEPNKVENEFLALQRYNELSNSCKQCIRYGQKCTHPAPNTSEKLNELMRTRNLRPFLMVLLIFALSTFTGLQAMRPYQVQIFKAYGVAVDANWATTAMGLSGICGTIVLLCVVRIFGKRKTYLFALSTTFKSCFSLGLYAWYHLPKGWSSFDKHEPIAGQEGDNLPFYIFLVLSFCTNLGVVAIPWMLVSEIFPMRTRILTSGLAAAFTYIMAFIATKTYYNLEMWLSMPGVTLLYAFIGLFGCIIVYFILPETENRTLEEIEIFFSEKTRKFTDRKIPKGLERRENTVELNSRKTHGVSTIVA